jgi:hypothetical protein
MGRDFGTSYEYRKSRDSSVGIALDYGLDDRGSRVRFPVGAGNFSLHHRVQNGIILMMELTYLLTHSLHGAGYYLKS